MKLSPWRYRIIKCSPQRGPGWQLDLYRRPLTGGVNDAVAASQWALYFDTFEEAVAARTSDSLATLVLLHRLGRNFYHADADLAASKLRRGLPRTMSTHTEPETFEKE